MSNTPSPPSPSCRECEVNDLELRHPLIAANDWRSPLVLRLLDGTNYLDGAREITVRYQWQSVAQTANVKLVWKGLASDFEKRMRTYQAPVLTEYATLGLACVLIDEFPKLQITEVTRRGERADYWLGNREYLLEVSGQQSGNLDTLRDTKRDQLLENPFGSPGFVCVAVYDEKSSYLWYYEVTP